MKKKKGRARCMLETRSLKTLLIDLRKNLTRVWKVYRFFLLSPPCLKNRVLTAATKTYTAYISPADSGWYRIWSIFKVFMPNGTFHSIISPDW